MLGGQLGKGPEQPPPPYWIFKGAWASPPAYTGRVAVQHSGKNGKCSIICTVLCCCTMCEHSPWQQLFPFSALCHADVMLCLCTLCGWGVRPRPTPFCVKSAGEPSWGPFTPAIPARTSQISHDCVLGVNANQPHYSRQVHTERVLLRIFAGRVDSNRTAHF